MTPPLLLLISVVTLIVCVAVAGFNLSRSMSNGQFGAGMIVVHMTACVLMSLSGLSTVASIVWWIVDAYVA